MTAYNFKTSSRMGAMLGATALVLLLGAFSRVDETFGTQLDRSPSTTSAQAPTPAPQLPQAPADAAITAEIKSLYAADDTLRAMQVQVLTREGLVSLEGMAPDAASRDHATRVAAKAKNVLSVDNHMKLPS